MPKVTQLLTTKQVREIADKWEKIAKRYPARYKANNMLRLSIKEVSDDINGLIDLALDRCVERGVELERSKDKDVVRLLSLDTEWKEFEESNRVAADKGQDAPAGIKRIVDTVRFLVGLIEPPKKADEPVGPAPAM